MITTQNTENDTAIDLDLSTEQESTIREAIACSGVSRDEIAKKALKRLLDEIRRDEKGHYHASI